MSRVSLEAKYAAETIKQTVDFASKLAVGETISSALVAASVYSGTDSSPSSILSGSASISGTKITQTITGGISGVTYVLNYQATTSLSQILVISAYLVIQPSTI